MAVSDTNLVLISGRLTRDPEARGKEKNVAAFSIASNRFYRDANGDSKEEVVFADCTAFRYEAEAILAKGKKGLWVLVEGRLEDNEWTTEEGETRKNKRILVNRVSGPGIRNGNGDSAPTATPTEDAKPEEVEVAATTSDDDIPF